MTTADDARSCLHSGNRGPAPLRHPRNYGKYNATIPLVLVVKKAPGATLTNNAFE